MSEQAQMLYLRLFLRTGPWFKLNSLSFSECDDIHATATQLEEAGLAENLERMPASIQKDAVKCMKILEIQAVLAALSLQPKKDSNRRPPTKSQLVHMVEDAFDDPKLVSPKPRLSQ